MSSLPADRTVIEQMATLGIIPVVTLPNTTGAVRVVEALIAGGLPLVELTLRTDAGLGAIEAARAAGTEALVGAGSVRSLTEARAAVSAGAQFLVSPGLDESIVAFAGEAGVEILPGVATATELMRARSLGVKVVKLFPAEAAGGARAVAALAAVFPDVRFVPTGGINPVNAAGYLRLPSVVAIGGTWVVPAEAVAAGDWATVTGLAERARKLAESVR